VTDLILISLPIQISCCQFTLLYYTLEATSKLLDYHRAGTTFEYPACESSGGFP